MTFLDFWRRFPALDIATFVGSMALSALLFGAAGAHNARGGDYG